MSIADLTNGQKWAIAAALIAGLGGSVWGVAKWRGGGEPQVALPRELTVEGMKAAAATPATAMDTFRSANRDDLTDEQRQQARQNMRQVFEDAMNERVTEYFASPEEEKIAVLDKHIDEMEAWRKAWEERRAEREAEEKKEGESDRPRGPMGPQTRDERKARSESRNPDQVAQQMTYFMALRGRMSERGISMPMGPGGMGGRGGPGGPPGGNTGRRGP